jgi:hypothetical protein
MFNSGTLDAWIQENPQQPPEHPLVSAAGSGPDPFQIFFF